MKSCLFCSKEGPFTKPEHIIPEALGNDDLVLHDEVCDQCNQYFGTKIENFVLGKTPFAFWRTFLGIRKKKGKLPHVDLSEPQSQKGRFPTIHPRHDNLVGFTCHSDYSVSADIDDNEIVREILQNMRNQFTFVFSPLVLFMMGRFLCKVGIELICSYDSDIARADTYSEARRFSRFGDFKGLWPIFHFQSGNMKDLKKQRKDSQGILEEVLCYHYQLFEVTRKYTVFSLNVGTDTWVISLNDPYPTQVICSAFPGQRLSLIWYRNEEIIMGKAQHT